MEEILQVGVITSTHGLRGEVKVFPTTDDAARFRRLKEVILDPGEEKMLLEIQGVKFFKKFVILKLKGIDSIDEAEKYRRKSLFVTRKNAVPLRRDEYFVADLVGLKVIDDMDQELGVLTEVLQTGANDVYVFDTPRGEMLLPALKEVVLSVDAAQKRMVLDERALERFAVYSDGAEEIG